MNTRQAKGHEANYLAAMTASKYSTKEVFPEDTEQEGLQMKCKH